ncbi:MAG: hypothetical protein RI900_1259 [Actinomycetota bacterium]|jgi:uncharacterized membrane protein
MKRREDLTTPRQSRRLGVHYDPDAFGQFSEGIARYLGTARYLVYQSGVIIVWVIWNYAVPESWQFDPWDRGLVLLTLVLSLQASYAAPLILLAQNRQEQRDRLQTETDRKVAERTQADTEFLAREIASVRLSLGDVATSSGIDDQFERLAEMVERLGMRLDALEARLDGAVQPVVEPAD